MSEMSQDRDHTANTYDVYSDPGHGWCKVPKAELVALGIAKKISKYSYVKGVNAYLEEDGDLMCFIDAKEKQDPGWKLEENSVEHHSNTDSEIRSFRRYSQ